MILICGHYKGIDERARELVVTREVSIGDYVLTGGELPALVIADAMVRRIEGVLHNGDSAATTASPSSVTAAWIVHGTPNPRSTGDWRCRRCCSPGTTPISRSGGEEQAIQRTRERRPDLLGDEDQRQELTLGRLRIRGGRSVERPAMVARQENAYPAGGQVGPGEKASGLGGRNEHRGTNAGGQVCGTTFPISRSATPSTWPCGSRKAARAGSRTSSAPSSPVRAPGMEATITVRKITGGIAVERIFPLESPNVDSITVKKRGRIRRAKLYYLRGRTGRKARIREARR